MDLGLKGKTAIVTGGGSGIGRETASLLIQAGTRVLILDMNLAAAQDTIARLGVGEDSALALRGDVSDEAVGAQAVQAVVDRWGGLDILCNVAGVLDQAERAGDVSMATWDRQLRINATGVFVMTKAALQVMYPARRGSIVNVVSEAGIRGGAAAAAYTSAKHAAIGLTRNTAVMYRDDGIRCNAICPGPTDTNIADSIQGQFSQAGLDSLKHVNVSMPPIRPPIEVARPTVFVASDAASYMNGAIVAVDGGWSAG